MYNRPTLISAPHILAILFSTSPCSAPRIPSSPCDPASSDRRTSISVTPASSVVRGRAWRQIAPIDPCVKPFFFIASLLSSLYRSCTSAGNLRLGRSSLSILMPIESHVIFGFGPCKSRNAQRALFQFTNSKPSGCLLSERTVTQCQWSSLIRHT